MLAKIGDKCFELNMKNTSNYFTWVKGNDSLAFLPNQADFLLVSVLVTCTPLMHTQARRGRAGFVSGMSLMAEAHQKAVWIEKGSLCS